MHKVFAPHNIPLIQPGSSFPSHAKPFVCSLLIRHLVLSSCHAELALVKEPMTDFGRHCRKGLR